MNQLIAIRSPVEIHAAASMAGATGAPTFAATAYAGGALPARVVKDNELPIVIDLAGMQPIRNMKADLDYNPQQRVGHVVEAINDGHTVQMNGVLSAATQYRDEIVKSAADGYEWEVSIQAAIDRADRIAPGESVLVNGQMFVGPILVARASRLAGVSFTDHGLDAANGVVIAAEYKADELVTMQAEAQYGEIVAHLAAKAGDSLDEIEAFREEHGELLDSILTATAKTIDDVQHDLLASRASPNEAERQYQTLVACLAEYDSPDVTAIAQMMRDRDSDLVDCVLSAVNRELGDLARDIELLRLSEEFELAGME